MLHQPERIEIKKWKKLRKTSGRPRRTTNYTRGLISYGNDSKKEEIKSKNALWAIVDADIKVVIGVGMYNTGRYCA